VGSLVNLVAIDPSTSATGGVGIAFFKNSILETATLVKPNGSSKTLQKRVIDIVKKAKQELELVFINTLVLEYPRIYTQTTDADPDDMLALAFVCGALMEGLPAKDVKLVRPSEWKGQVPKKIHNARVVSKLADHEQHWIKTARNNHNVIDAIGIGLWALGRR
jgi:hypothetical protein